MGKIERRTFDALIARIENETGCSNTVSGTSFSAPHMVGVSARVQEAAEEIADRPLTQEEFVFVVQESCTDIARNNGDAAGYNVADGDLAVGYFTDKDMVFA